jgi:hypothetical protein
LLMLAGVVAGVRTRRAGILFCDGSLRTPLLRGPALLLLPPGVGGFTMNEHDISGIELAVGVTLPAHYRRFLADHAEELRDAKAKLPMRAVLYFAADDIIGINAGLRDNPRMIEINEDSEPWPLNYFVVGTNGGGDFWMVDLDDPREAIWQYDSEAGGRIGPAEFRSWAEYMAAIRHDMRNPKKWR